MKKCLLFLSITVCSGCRIVHHIDHDPINHRNSTSTKTYELHPRLETAATMVLEAIATHSVSKIIK